MDLNGRNLFLYWIDGETDLKLIKILRNLIYLYSTSGKGYNVHLITPNNIINYIDDIPEFFFKLKPAHQADYVRVNVIYKYGGIWMDSDTIILTSLDSLFDLVENKDGFFILENNKFLCNGIFGSKKQTKLMNSLKNLINNILYKKKENISFNEIGGKALRSLNKELYNNYKIFDNYFPYTMRQISLVLLNNKKNMNDKIEKWCEKNKLCFLVLNHKVYRWFWRKKVINIFNDNDLPIYYFINKSFDNLELINYDILNIKDTNYFLLNNNKAIEKDEEIDIENIQKIFYKNKVQSLKKLELNTSNNYKLLEVLYKYLNYLPERFMPEEIIINNEKKICSIYKNLGYKINKNNNNILMKYIKRVK